MNEEQEATRGYCRSADLGSTLAYMGSLVSFLVGAADSGGGLVLMVNEARKGNEPPPHWHEWENETFYMLEGEVRFFVEGLDHVLTARPGDLVFLPRGKAHAFLIDSPTAKAIAVLQALDGKPIGSEAYFRQIAVGPAKSMLLPPETDHYAHLNPDAMQEARDLAKRHNIVFLTDQEIARRIPLFPSRTLS